jgi:hypothetical protein
MTVTKIARQQRKNNAPNYGYPLAPYRNILEYVNGIVLTKRVNIANLPHDKSRINLIEKLVHSASGRAAAYTAFDTKFHEPCCQIERAAGGREPKFQPRYNSSRS